MKPNSPELKALLATRQFYSADLFTFTGGNLGSTVLRFTSGDQTIVANGYIYLAGGQTGPYFDRQDNKAKSHWKIGVEVDTMIFDLIPGNYVLFGTSMQQCVKYGLFDGAEVTIERAYMPTYGNTAAGTIVTFVGRVAEVQSYRSIITFNINSHLELLNLQMPRMLYMSGCRYNLGDPGCGITLSSFSTTGTISSGSTNHQINCSISGTFPTGAFNLGKIVMTSGFLNGLAQTITSLNYGTPNTMSLMGYFPVAPNSGDTFTIYYGCDKSFGPTVSVTGNTNGSSAAITNLSTITGLQVNDVVVGPGIATGTYVTGVLTNSVTLSAATTSVNTGATYTFYSSPNGCSKFNNTARYGGFPLVPQPSTAI